MESIINDSKYCFVCGTTHDLHRHHVFGGPNRSNSEDDGLWVYLCAKHHNMSDDGVHFNKDLGDAIKRLAQMRYEQEHTRGEFMARYGKNYL